MKLADVSIRRPVFAFMMSAAIVVLGVASYRQLGLDLMPKTDFPMVVVRTSLPGASAEEIESQITKPVEEVVAKAAVKLHLACGVIDPEYTGKFAFVRNHRTVKHAVRIWQDVA